MKKLLSFFCFILCLHSIASPASDTKLRSGEKQLVKALTAIVNREGNKKVDYKKVITLPGIESPPYL